MSDLGSLLLELTGRAVEIERRPQPAGGLPARRYGDPSRAKEALGFVAKTDLRDGAKRLIEWRRQALAASPARTA